MDSELIDTTSHHLNIWMLIFYKPYLYLMVLSVVFFRFAFYLIIFIL